MSSSGSNAWAPSFEWKALRICERTGRAAIEIRWVFRYVYQHQPSHGAVRHVDSRLRTAVAHHPMLLASDPSPVLKATRERSPSCCRCSFFGNQVDLVRYEEARVGVYTDVFGPFLCLQGGRA